MPLAAMFILFESTVLNLPNPETRENLLFLDTAAGYFGRLEYDTGGALQGSIFSEITLIAREFVQKEQQQKQSRSLFPWYDTEITNGTNIAPPSPPPPPFAHGIVSGVSFLESFFHSHMHQCIKLTIDYLVDCSSCQKPPPIIEIQRTTTTVNPTLRILPIFLPMTLVSLTL